MSIALLLPSAGWLSCSFPFSLHLIASMFFCCSRLLLRLCCHFLLLFNSFFPLTQALFSLQGLYLLQQVVGGMWPNSSCCLCEGTPRNSEIAHHGPSIMGALSRPLTPPLATADTPELAVNKSWDPSASTILCWPQPISPPGCHCTTGTAACSCSSRRCGAQPSFEQGWDSRCHTGTSDQHGSWRQNWATTGFAQFFLHSLVAS